MHGNMIHKDSDLNPPFMKKVHVYSGESSVCLEYPGKWEFVPEPKQIRLDQTIYPIDTSVFNFIDLQPGFFALQG